MNYFCKTLVVLLLVVIGSRFIGGSLYAATYAGDVILYDGEAGSAPLLGGSWAVGNNGVILFGDGEVWSQVASPTANTLRAVTAASDLQVWAVGDAGTLARLNPTNLQWITVSSPATNNRAIKANWWSDIWAAGDGGVVLHYQGANWMRLDSGCLTNFYALDSLDPSHVWVAGAGGTLRFYNGTQWVRSTIPTTVTLRGIHATAANDVWAVGDAGVILHWDGTAWNLSPSGVMTNLNAVWASAANSAWAAGAGGLILKWDGAQWLPETTASTANLLAVSGRSPIAVGETGALLYRTWNGQWVGWLGLTTNALLSVTQLSPSCIEYMHQSAGAGRNGSTGLQLEPDPWHTPAYNLYCGSGNRTDFTPFDVVEFYFRCATTNVGDPGFWLNTWNQQSKVIRIQDFIQGGIIDDTWRRVRIPLTNLVTADWTLGNVERLFWGTDSQSRTYFVDDIALRVTTPPFVTQVVPASSTVLSLQLNQRYDFASMRVAAHYTLSSPTDPDFRQGVSASESGILLRIQALDSTYAPINRHQTFIRFATPMKSGHVYTLAVTGVANASHIPIVPATFTFTYDDRTQLNPDAVKVNQVGYLPGRPKRGYVGGYFGELGGGGWSVGDNGSILFWNKYSGWSAVNSPVTNSLRAIAATSETDAWAVGDAGILLHWNGTNWIQSGLLTTNDLNAITFGPQNAGWAVGANGVILNFDGHSWTNFPSPTLQHLRGICVEASFTGTLGTRGWAVGDHGTILRYDGSQWINYASPTTANLLAVASVTDDRVLAVGENSTGLLLSYGLWSQVTSVPNSTTTLRAVAAHPNGGFWAGGDGGQLWVLPGFGYTSLTAIGSGTTNDICSLAFLHARQVWGGTRAGGLISGQLAGDWNARLPVVSSSINGMFALPAGPLRLPDPPPAVTLQDASTGVPVLTVPLALRSANNRLAGEDVYTFDFSSFDTPGNYRAYVPGLGLSYPFRIGSDVYDLAAYHTGRLLYYQRSGTPIVTPYAEPRFARPAAYEYDVNGRRLAAAFDASITNSALYNGEVVGSLRDAHGGWFDAGDYGKYVITGAGTLWYLLTAYDLFPDRFTDGQWNIPESGNGVPDILDEARWELDWMARIQADDGGIYGRVTASQWWDNSPELDNRLVYLTEKTTADTAVAAAVLASASRQWKKFDTNVATFYLSRAQLAWSFLTNHPTNLPVGGSLLPPGWATGVYNDPDDSDNRAWAAAELYRATGQAAYRNAFLAWWATGQHGFGWLEASQFFKQAMWAYLQSNWPDTDPDIQSTIRGVVLSNADNISVNTEGNVYAEGGRLDVPDWIGYGTFCNSTLYSYVSLLAYALTSDSKYLDTAVKNLDVQLGDNPLSECFITGLGSRYPQAPLQGQSVYDNVAEPIPGVPVFGVQSHLSEGDPNAPTVQSDANNYPYCEDSADAFPNLRRYVDNHTLPPMSEWGVGSLAPTLVVFNILSTAKHSAPSTSGISNQPPIVPAIPDQTAIAGLLLNFPITAFNPNGSGHSLHWSFGSSAPSGAVINPTNGIFSWRPSSAEAFSTNVVFITVADADNSALSHISTARIMVLPAPELGARFSMTDSAVQLNFSTMPGTLYQVQFTPSLSVPVWQDLGPATAAQQTNIVIEVQRQADTECFYRLVLKD